MDETSLVFGGVLTVAIVAGFVLALIELGHMREQSRMESETRQIQLVDELSQVPISLEGQRLYHDFMYME